MKPGNIILALAGAAVLVVLGFLLLEVKGGSDADVSPEEQARALAEYRRHHAVAETPAPSELAADPGSSHRAPKPEPKPATPSRPLRMHGSDRSDEEISDRRPPPRLDEPEHDQEKVDERPEATRLYDHGDYPAALEAALKVLESDPRNIKMLRIVVSTKCSLNEVESARAYLRRLPRRDQRQMRTRCKNWGVDL